MKLKLRLTAVMGFLATLALVIVISPKVVIASPAVQNVCTDGNVAQCMETAIREAHSAGSPIDVSFVKEAVSGFINVPFGPGKCYSYLQSYNRTASSIRKRFGVAEPAATEDCEQLIDVLHAVLGYPWLERRCAGIEGRSSLEICYAALVEMGSTRYGQAMNSLGGRYGVNGRMLELVGLSNEEVLKATKRVRFDLDTMIRNAVNGCISATSTSQRINAGFIGYVYRQVEFQGGRFNSRAETICPQLYLMVKAKNLVDARRMRSFEKKMPFYGGDAAQIASASIVREDGVKRVLSEALKPLCDSIHQRLYAAGSPVKNIFNRGVCRHEMPTGFTGSYAVLLGDKWYYEWFIGEVDVRDCNDRECSFTATTACYHSIGKLRPTCEELARTKFKGTVKFDKINQLVDLKLN